MQLDSPQIPLVLLIYGMQTLLTTAVCIWEYVHWITVSTDVKWNLTGLYGPYIALCTFINTSPYLTRHAMCRCYIDVEHFTNSFQLF